MSVVIRFSLKQYEEMIDAGVFDGAEHRRLELLRGEIVPMSPIGTVHWRMVNILTHWSTNVTDEDEVEVSVQNPIAIPANDSAPEPDITWLKAKKYTEYVRPDDVLLVIEIADTTMRIDTVLKASIYAEAGIEDYWVVDLSGGAIHVCREPRRERYTAITMSKPGDKLSPLSLPDVSLDVEEAFGKL